MTFDNQTDMTEMYAIHDCLRAEFSRLPGLVEAVAPGDSARAGVVGGHVMVMTSVLHAHHEGEDELVWPVLQVRSPEHVQLVEEMTEQHGQMVTAIDRAQEQAQAWMADAGEDGRAALMTTLAGLNEDMVAHLEMEEREVVPLISRDMTQDEYAAVGAHSRASLSPEQLAVGLGLILADTTPERGEAILAGMPAEGRAAFEQFGVPIYEAYAARLAGA